MNASTAMLTRRRVDSRPSGVLLLEDPFQLPLETLQGGRDLISPNRRLTVVAVARVHQDADVLEFFLDQGEIMAEQSSLFARQRVSSN